jgi:nucleoside-diphosphate-sugar epimerase
MTETVLVTGGSGFIAGWCIVDLLQRGYAVRATLRSLSKEASVSAAIASAASSTRMLSFVAADLTRDEGWGAAMTGCDHVLHVASPLGGDGAAKPQALIAAARDGTLRVLRAATTAGVKRIVMTSAATTATPPLSSAQRSLSDETVWFDPAERNVDAYRQSKRLAERAAWDFMKEQGGSTTLTTILPGAVFGPVLTTENLGSVQVIGRLLQGRMPANPRLGFEIVDVRDLASLRISAMASAAAAGQRFIAVGEFLWMIDISRVLRAQLGEAASKVPTRILPDFVLRLMSLADPALRAMTPRLGREHRHLSTKAQGVLGWHTRPAAVTLVDCARSLLTGAVYKLALG